MPTLLLAGPALEVVMVRSIAVVTAVLLISLFGFPQEKQEKKENPPPAPEFKIPAEEAKRENPIKPTETSVAEGKRLHVTQCAMCHGKDGDGKGELGVEMKLSMRDWRDPAALKDFTDGALFYVLHKGKDTMPGQEGRMRAEQEWNLINFIRSLAKKAPVAPAKAEKPD